MSAIGRNARERGAVRALCASADLGNGVRSRRGVFRGRRSGSTQLRIEISHVASHLKSTRQVTKERELSRDQFALRGTHPTQRSENART